jgi:hypothetical protein
VDAEPEAERAEREKRARAAFLANMAILPGLGTLLSGHRLLGLAQMATAGAGFLLICRWLVGFVSEALQTMGLPAGGGRYGREGWLGLVLSFGALGWSGWTSYRRWRAARAQP